MRKIYSLALLAALMLAGASPSSAQSGGGNTATQDNYSFGFNSTTDLGLTSTTSTSKHDFAPAGWSHIVDVYTDWYDEDYYVDYSFSANGGVDGSGCLRAGSQTIGAYYSATTVYDLLVTPVVSGTVSFKVKGIDSESSVKIYNTTYSYNIYERGSEITDTTMSAPISEDGWTTITLNIPESEAKNIGIRLNQAYIDDFSASKAVLTYRPGLSIKKASIHGDTRDIDADANGNLNLGVDVILQNTGAVDLTPGYPNYTLSVMRGTSTYDTLFTVPVNVALPVGATSDTIHVTGQTNLATLPAGASYRLSIAENLTGTNEYVAYITPYDHKPDFRFTDDNTYSSSTTLRGTVDFGNVQQETTKRFRIRNNGGAELTVNNVAVTGDFRLDSESGPFTVPAHSSSLVSVTLPVTTTGTKTGAINVTYSNDSTYSLDFTGNVLDSTKWYVPFDGYSFPAGFENDGWSVSAINQDRYSGNSYYATHSSVTPTKLITPKLNVKAGDVLSFDANRYSDYNDGTLSVYYSADRKNWTLLRTVSSAEGTAPEDTLSNENVSTSSYNSFFAFRNFTIDNIPAGQWYIAFEGQAVGIDNIYGCELATVAHDLDVTAFSADKTGTVNHKAKFSATVSNNNTKDEPAGYQAKLFVGSNEVAAAATPIIPVSSTQDFAFEYTPHEAGTFPVHFELQAADGYVISSDTDTIVVSEEVATANQQVGIPDASSATRHGVLDPYNKISESVTAYKASDIALPAGTQIKGILYKGYLGSGNNRSVALQVYIRNSSKEELTTANAMAEIADTVNAELGDSAYTKVYDGYYDLEPAGTATGSYTPTITETGDLIHITFPQPFIYNGQSLIVAVHGAVSAYISSSNISWEAAAQTGQSAYRSNDSSLPDYFSAQNMPVVYLDVDKETSTLSGTITSAATSQPLEGVTVKLINGDILYSATTDAQGKYSMTVIQDGLKYNLRIEKAGYTPYYKDNVSAAGQNTLNIALKDASGFYVTKTTIPATGSVNHKFTATVNALNTESETIAADTYTAKLYVGSEAVAETTAPAVESGASHDYSFEFTPHEAGTFNAYVELAYGDKKSYSDTIAVTIDEESGLLQTQAGDSTTISNAGEPLNFYYRNAEAEVIYTAQQLGIPAGSKIKRIAFRGYVPSPKGSYAPYYSAFIENTTDATPVSSGTTTLVDTTAMTRLAGGNIDLSEAKGTETSPVDLLVFDIPDGFVYTGGNIRLALHQNGTSYNRAYWVSDGNVRNQSTWRGGDTESTFPEQTFKDNSTDNYLPVAYITAEANGTISGKISNSNDEGIAGAVVTLTSGDVIYTATTDNSGNYTIDVKQPDKTYDATVSADGYATATTAGAVSFADGSETTFSTTLKKIVSISGTVTGVSVVDGALTAPTPLSDATILVTTDDGSFIGLINTAADGTYSVDSLTEGTNYKLFFSAAGYNDSTATVTTGAADQTIDVTLYTQDALGINGISVSGKDAVNGEVYNLNGQFIGRNVDLGTLRRGVYIINGKKITVK